MKITSYIVGCRTHSIRFGHIIYERGWGSASTNKKTPAQPAGSARNRTTHRDLAWWPIHVFKKRKEKKANSVGAEMRRPCGWFAFGLLSNMRRLEHRLPSDFDFYPSAFNWRSVATGRGSPLALNQFNWLEMKNVRTKLMTKCLMPQPGPTVFGLRVCSVLVPVFWGLFLNCNSKAKGGSGKRANWVLFVVRAAFNIVK